VEHNHNKALLGCPRLRLVLVSVTPVTIHNHDGTFESDLRVKQLLFALFGGVLVLLSLQYLIKQDFILRCLAYARMWSSIPASLILLNCPNQYFAQTKLSYTHIHIRQPHFR
jgi:hypothetical protein